MSVSSLFQPHWGFIFKRNRYLFRAVSRNIFYMFGQVCLCFTDRFLNRLLRTQGVNQSILLPVFPSQVYIYIMYIPEAGFSLSWRCRLREPWREGGFQGGRGQSLRPGPSQKSSLAPNFNRFGSLSRWSKKPIKIVFFFSE